jgi:hypothetical protein
LACTGGFGNGRESDIYNSIRESEASPDYARGTRFM